MARWLLQMSIIAVLTFAILLDWRVPAALISTVEAHTFYQHTQQMVGVVVQSVESPTARPRVIRTKTPTATPSVTPRRTSTKRPSLTRTVTPSHTASPRATRTPLPSATRTSSPTATRSAGARVPAGMMGIVGRDPFYEVVDGKVNTRGQATMGRIMKSMGVRWVRIDMRIPLVMGASQNDIDVAISRYDYFVNTVAPANNLKVLMLLSFDLIMGVDANQIAVGPYTTHPRYGPGYNAYMTEWMSRAQRVITRYGKNIHAIEVLNEANRLPRYTDAGPINNGIPAETWAQLVTTIYRSCNGTRLGDYCRSTPVILGGLHPRGTEAYGRVPARSDMEYLADIYASRAFTTSFAQLNRWPLDSVGYHPYPWELKQIGVLNQTAAFDRVRQQLVIVNDPLRPIWVTEIGYNVAYARQTEAEQATFLADVYRTLATRKLANGKREVPVVFWFKYEDFPPANGVNAQQWGLVRIPFAPGPCPDGMCYRRSGEPQRYRQSWYTYRDLTMP